MMHKFMVPVFAVTACQLVNAQTPPVVGVWEQLAVASKPGDQAPQRRDFIFTNQKLDADTVFSGLVDVGPHAAVLCCVKANKDASLSLANLAPPTLKA